MNNIEYIECRKINKEGGEASNEFPVIKEHNLTIIVNETPVFRLVCTKDNLKELVYGRLYTEGIINSAEDVEKIYFCKIENEASIFLKDSVSWNDEIPLEKSCCTGNRVFKSAGKQNLQPLQKLNWDNEWIFSLARKFSEDTKLHTLTGGTHSCILAHKDEYVFSCEDIGRHNAVDKAVGYGLLNNVDLSESIIYTSGRVPVDMVEKVISAKVPVLVSKSVPTAESIELAKEYGLCLICRAHSNRFDVIC